MKPSIMKRTWPTLVRRTVFLILAIPATVLLVRAFDARNMPDLQVWHRTDLSQEFRAKQFHATMTFEDYLNLENKLFAQLDEEVYNAIKTQRRHPYNRYDRGSLCDPVNFERNWNRSFELVPENIQGGILLLHGLTDSPYSLRTIAQIFYDHHYYVLCPRIPGHGTIPAALTTIQWQDWMPVVKMAARHVRNKVGSNKCFYLGGYSNGGALAVKYAMDSLKDDTLDLPDKMYLFSPAIGVTRFAPLANWHKTLSFIPYFEKFKWQSIEFEYDPFKYNSFPKNAGDQIYLLSKVVQNQIDRAKSNGSLRKMPPIITFQSVVDSTVVSADLIDKLYDKLETNHNELIVFDVNRFAQIEAFFKPGYHTLLPMLVAISSPRYKLTVLTNASADSVKVVARTRTPSSDTETVEALDLTWPRHVYSLSHLAIPFPPEDPLYGIGQSEINENILSIGTLEPRGEKNLLNISVEQLLRLRHNPFFGYMKRRIVETIEHN